ncbi:MAG TPA: DNA primase [Terriglobia bacterium]|nr:DNA primase [Terriglobia bacterium]
MSDVDQVRAAADIVKIVGDYVKLRKAGANYMGLCPFHQEKSPSFAVHPVKQIFHCFGCGVGGDVFKFVMLMDSLPFPEALRRVAEKVGVRLEQRAGDETYDANTKLRAELIKLHEIAAKFFAAQLGATAEGRMARAYLADRGMTDEVVGRFRIGYAPGDGQGLVRQFAGSDFEKDALEKSGLIIFDTERQRPYDRFRRRIIYPIANDAGKVVAFAGRALGDDQPKYLNSPETAIYTKSRLLYHLDRAAQAIRKLDYVILVEGYMDCIAVASSGIENVVASCGTSLTEGQIRLLGRYTRRVVVNYDPDSAGVAATERSLALLLEAGFEAKVLALPGGLDPDEFIRKQGVKAYGELLANAPSYLDYLTERAAKNHDIGTPEGKVAAANAILPYLVKVPNPMLRAELAGRLAERLRVDERLLRDELRRAAGEKRGEVRVAQGMTADANHGVKQLLRACLESEEMADELLPEILESGAMGGLLGESLFKQLWEARQRNEKLSLAESEGVLSTEEKRLAYDALFWPGAPPNLEQAKGHLRKLKIERLERDRGKLKREIETAAQSQDSARLTALQRAKSNLDKELRQMARP